MLFYSVCHQLLAVVATEVVDLLDYIPVEKHYEMLKNAVIRHIRKSDERMLHNLFNNLNLCHTKPSQLLRKMRALLGDNSMSNAVL